LGKPDFVTFSNFGLGLGSNRFLLLPHLLQKLMFDTEMVKNNSKITILLP
jgi:hypothetical protein